MPPGLLSQSLDFTDRDFDSLRARLRNIISSVFPTWTDDNVADFGNILIEEFAFVGDVTAKYQDAQSRETRWTQATQRKSILSLVAMIGYQPRGISAATAEETFTLLSGPAAADVVLPAGSTVSTLDVGNTITFQLLAPLTIAAGTTTATATVENSSFSEDVFQSSGLPNQRFSLGQTPYIDGTASVVAADGAYVQVANFLNSGATDRHYVLSVDSNARATIIFGNGVLGAVPQGTITVDSKIGGGSAGRVDANTLQQLNGTFTDAHGNAVQIGVNNAFASVGGDDAQTVAQIQQLAPLSVRVAGGRTIAREDFEIGARLVPGVARALMTTSNEDPGVQENRGILYLVPPGAGVLPQSTIDAVAAYFTANPYPTCFRLSIRQAPYLVVNVFATIYRAAGVSPSQAKASVTATLQSLFADTIQPLGVFRADGSVWQPSATNPNPDAGKVNPLIDFGFNLQNADGSPIGGLPFSDVYEAIALTRGIRKVGAGALDVTLNGARADLAIGVNQFPVLGAVQLVDGFTGQVL